MTRLKSSRTLGAVSARAATLVLAVAALVTPLAAQAMTFAEAFDAAKRNDAQYLAAGHELNSAQLAVPIAFSALLPSINFSASSADVSGTRQFPNSLNQDVRVRVEYAAPQASLQMRLPLFNQEARIRWQQTRSQADVAESIYRARGMELIDRLAGAYLQVLLAEEGRELAQAQITALQVQLGQVQQRLQRGEGTRVEVAQVLAALDVTKVRAIESDDLLDLSRRQLRRITGVPNQPLQRVPADFTPNLARSETLFDWLETALRQSPTLQARQQSLLVARMNVQRNEAGHFPRVDLVASLSRSQNESLSNLNQSSNLRTLGVQLNVPIYSGGGINAGVKQALSDQARAEEEIRIERENIEIEVQRHHGAVTNGAAKIAAYRQAVTSSELALEGMRKVLEQGLGTNNDVADALVRLYSARRDLAQARIEYVQARLRLLVQAGTPMNDAVAELDRALVAAPGNTPKTETLKP